MNISQRILSDLAVHMKYARYRPEVNRREDWGEIVMRNLDMHLKKFKDDKPLLRQVGNMYDYVFDKKILPSMRSLQFGGLPIERNPSRIYNCAYLPIEHPDAFSETMFLLLGGTGVGYSVQKQHVAKLPPVVGPLERRKRYKIGDSIEGWADAIKVLMESYFYGKSKIRFDYTDIREKGSELVVTGGKAPGPAPLRKCLIAISNILDDHRGGGTLEPLAVHDILCHIADGVLAGGIRRAAMIALFSKDDNEMMTCKHGNWWETQPQRGRANNSVILLRSDTKEDEFTAIWKAVEASNAGEPGIYWTNDLDWGTNPCAEIALRPYQFCNLVEINGSDVENQEDLNMRAQAASFIATLQASYTDFHYLREVWKETTEEDALIGVGITGIASGALQDLNLYEAANVVKGTNINVAAHIGVNSAARCTTIKPSGTSSIVLGSSSGIHAWHNDYYIRRMRVNKDESIYGYLKQKLPQFVEDSVLNPEGEAILSIPQKAPDGATTRKESPYNLLYRTLAFNKEWVRAGHVRGENPNNVSATISLKPDEWKNFGEAMWETRNEYNGISVLPFDGGSYVQAPFEDCEKALYDVLSMQLHEIDLKEVKEDADYTDLTAEAACAGGACDVTL